MLNYQLVILFFYACTPTYILQMILTTFPTRFNSISSRTVTKSCARRQLRNQRAGHAARPSSMRWSLTPSFTAWESLRHDHFLDTIGNYETFYQQQIIQRKKTVEQQCCSRNSGKPCKIPGCIRSRPNPWIVQFAGGSRRIGNSSVQIVKDNHSTQNKGTYDKPPLPPGLQ